MDPIAGISHTWCNPCGCLWSSSSFQLIRQSQSGQSTTRMMHSSSKELTTSLLDFAIVMRPGILMCNKNINDHLRSSSRNRNTMSDCMIHWKHLAFLLWFFIFPFSICSLPWRRQQHYKAIGVHRGTLSLCLSLYASPSLSFLFLVVPWLSANVERSWPHMHEALRYIHARPLWH